MESVILIEDLKMKFLAKEVLKGVNVKVNRGEIIGYIGPNGAGKSTTVKIILGLVEGYTGSIKIFGEDIENGSVEYKRKIGYVPEGAELYDNLTACEYLSFIGQVYGIEEEQIHNRALKLMSLFGVEDAYYNRISSYSKGMRQKLLIISALIHNPEIIFLDEPLNGLDANSVMILKEILILLSEEGKTIFYSSHIMDVVEKISSRIILLNNGVVEADGTFEELKKSSKEGSLEQIFNELTGFNEHKEIAKEFISIIKEV
ncbi:MAG: ABC transporter ATP-binding protein [Clostridiaceae bacterium]